MLLGAVSAMHVGRTGASAGCRELRSADDTERDGGTLSSGLALGYRLVKGIHSYVTKDRNIDEASFCDVVVIVMKEQVLARRLVKPAGPGYEHAPILLTPCVNRIDKRGEFGYNTWGPKA